MKNNITPKRISFRSKLERISPTAEYYALSVPLTVSQKLQTRSAVPVLAQVNDSTPFRSSLFPVGGGRHYMRVKEDVRTEVKIRGGSPVQVRIEIVDRKSEVALPQELARALNTEELRRNFNSISIGRRSYIIRQINSASKPETRRKRIQEAVQAASQSKLAKRAKQARKTS